ncbi:187_t:CDS:2, partial [Gigaspora margarita]
MPIKDIESQLFKNKHLNKVFSLFKSIGNGKFWIGFLLEIVLVIVIFVINIFWENHWFNLVISSFNLLLFAYVMNQCVEGIADRSNNFLTGLINNMGGNIAELFAVIIFMKSDQALLAGFTIIGSSISTVMIVPALAAIISIFRSKSLKPFKFNAIDAQNMLINLYVLSFKPRNENEFYIRIKENNIEENNEENNTENNEENNTGNNKVNNTEKKKENNTEKKEENNTEKKKENNTEKKKENNTEFKNSFKDLLKHSTFIINEIEENSQDANDTNEENLENEDDKNAKKRLIELILLILLFAITCAGFYFVGEIFSDSIQKTPLSERLAFVGIFFTPAMLDVPEHLNTISLFVKNTDLAMITSFGSSCQILGFVYPVGTLISVGLGANPNIPFPPDFVGIYFLVLLLAYNIINDGKFTLHEGLALFTTAAM